MAPSVLPQATKEFRSHRPELQLQLFDGDAATIMQRVESRALDVGLGIFFKHLPGIQRIPLFRFSLVAIRPDTGQATPVTISWSALKREKLISLPSVLSADPLSVEENSIRVITSLMTMVGGRIVYETPNWTAA
jgi:DNA-binding transcriptional LysR family regulator